MSRAPTPTDVRVGRLRPLDDWRGLLMVVMALDHANSFIADGKAGVEWWVQMPVYGDEALQFLTRWVTHIAAPGFFFLMGAGAVLLRSARVRQGWTEGAVVKHLVLRGTVLVLLQFLVVNFAWDIGDAIPGNELYFGVLAALGSSLIIVSLLLRLPWYVQAGAGALLLVLAEVVVPSTWQLFSSWEVILLWPGYSADFLVLYSLVPALGVTMLGLAFGRALVADSARTMRMALPLGLASLAAFVVLKLIDGPGIVAPIPDSGWIGFLSVVKYPFSITFVLLTLGLGLLFLAWRTTRDPSERHPLQVFGRTALFFYVTHLFLYGLGGQIVGKPTGIPAMFPWWIVGLVLLYPLCWYFGRFKRSQPIESLWRMF